MKKVILLALYAVLSPAIMLHAAQETPVEKKQATSKKIKAKKNGTKKSTKKPAGTTKTTRSATTSAGKRSSTTTRAKKHTIKADTSKNPRTKTTAAGTKAKSTKSPKTSKPKTTAASRATKTSYKNKPATHKATAAKTDTHKPKATRAYHKGGVKYRQFNRLNEMHAENFGVISRPSTKTVTLNKPGRGYVNANLINLTTADGKQGRLLFDTHNRTATQAQKKGLGLVATKTVEVYAGTDSNDLALIGEYPLAKGSENVQLDVDPSGQVILSDNGTPFTKFSIHQHQK